MRLDPKLQQVRGIFLFPNLLTTAALFAAFYSIIAAFKGHLETAAIAIFVAMLADGFDGRVARLTHTESAFGAEYDSLSDMVAFGVAPALVVYSWALQRLGKLGWLIAFLYAASAALRLARFNTQLGVLNKRYFQGLPSPPAAALLASSTWFFTVNEMTGFWLNLFMLVLTAFAAILMVSNIRYNSFKELDLKNKVPFVAVLLIVLIFTAVSVNPPVVLFISFFCYALSGPLLTLWRLHRVGLERRRRKLKS